MTSGAGKRQEKQGAAPLELEGFLPYRLSILSNTVSRTIADSYEKKFCLTIPEWRVLAVLGRDPGLSAADVAERTAMDKVAVSRAVASLVRAGRVRRRLASNDRRRLVLELAPKGLKVYQAIAPEALLYEKNLVAGLNAEERSILTEILDKLWDQAVKIRKTNLE